jgi:two-component system chemotaxis sensor kinase CheA
VDAILGQQQVIIKPLHGFLGQIRGSAGCALLGTGEVAIALDVDQLFLNGGEA